LKLDPETCCCHEKNCLTPADHRLRRGLLLIGIKVAGPDPLARVKRIALIAATASLLAGCQSSQEFCAEYKAGDAKNAQALKKLGLKQERNWFYNPQKLERYCQ